MHNSVLQMTRDKAAVASQHHNGSRSHDSYDYHGSEESPPHQAKRFCANGGILEGVAGGGGGPPIPASAVGSQVVSAAPATTPVALNLGSSSISPLHHGAPPPMLAARDRQKAGNDHCPRSFAYSQSMPTSPTMFEKGNEIR